MEYVHYKLSLSFTIIFVVPLYEVDEALLLVSLNNNDSSIFVNWSFLYLLFYKLLSSYSFIYWLYLAFRKSEELMPLFSSGRFNILYISRLKT